MTLRLTNALERRVEEFQPLASDRVLMYHCGPTVKEPSHIAKFRSYLLADVLRRHLERSGFEVRQVMNITDVGHLNEFEEDIVEVAAARRGLQAWELAEREEKIFHEDRRALKIVDAHVYPKARDHIDCMVEMIRALEEKGVCYRAGGNLYLDVSHQPRFGELCGKSLAEMEVLQKAAKTSPHPEKRHPLDIDLWRTDALHQMDWESPWGRGFPGWHVECAAMSRKYLGECFDVHTGTVENVFPHHECEIAQAEILSGKPMARYWLHSGPVTVEGKPMSLGNRNLVTVRGLLEDGFRGSVVRAALLSSHYREALDFREETIDRARAAVDQVLGFHNHLCEQSAARAAEERREAATAAAWINETGERVQRALDDDLDYWGALGAVVETVDRLEPEDVGDPRQALEALESWDRVLGLL